jgi:uncharacterized integral membrane protein
VDDGDLKPLDDEKARKEDSDEDVMILEVDESAEAVDEVEEVEEVRPARPKSGPRTKRRQEKPEPEESDSVRAVIILGAIVAGLIILLLTFIFIKRAMHSEGTASTKHPPGSATVLVMSHTGADHWGVQSTSSV